MEIIETVVEVESEDHLTVVVLEVSGDCSEEADSKKLHHQLTADPGRRYFIVDLSNAFVNSRCIGMLIAAVKMLRDTGDADVRLVAPAVKPMHYGDGNPVFEISLAAGRKLLRATNRVIPRIQDASPPFCCGYWPLRSSDTGGSDLVSAALNWNGS
jgi:anti-anti-sigma regulatory factor